MHRIVLNNKGTTSDGIWVAVDPLHLCQRSLSPIYSLQIAHNVMQIKILLCCGGCDTLYLIEQLELIIREINYSHRNNPPTFTWLILRILLAQVCLDINKVSLKPYHNVVHLQPPRERDFGERCTHTTDQTFLAPQVSYEYIHHREEVVFQQITVHARNHEVHMMHSKTYSNEVGQRGLLQVCDDYVVMTCHVLSTIGCNCWINIGK